MRQWSCTVLPYLKTQVRDFTEADVALVTPNSKASLDETFEDTLDVTHVLSEGTASWNDDIVHVRNGDVRWEAT